MRTYRITQGIARIEPSGEDFWLVTLEMDAGYHREIYVAAAFPDEAVQKAFKFYYGKESKKLERI